MLEVRERIHKMLFSRAKQDELDLFVLHHLIETGENDVEPFLFDETGNHPDHEIIVAFG